MTDEPTAASLGNPILNSPYTPPVDRPGFDGGSNVWFSKQPGQPLRDHHGPSAYANFLADPEDQEAKARLRNEAVVTVGQFLRGLDHATE
jgi:hypothetical protein